MLSGMSLGHAPRERVSWNDKALKETNKKSVTLHVSVWVEIDYDDEDMLFYNGHAPRERVSWNDTDTPQGRFMLSHAPRERVSWNDTNGLKRGDNNVTLHVSVWVEISRVY